MEERVLTRQKAAERAREELITMLEGIEEVGDIGFGHQHETLEVRLTDKVDPERLPQKISSFPVHYQIVGPVHALK